MIDSIEKLNARFSRIKDGESYQFSEMEHRILGWSTAIAAVVLALGLYFATT